MSGNDDIKKAFKGGYAKGFAKACKPRKEVTNMLASSANEEYLKYMEEKTEGKKNHRLL